MGGGPLPPALKVLLTSDRCSDEAGEVPLEVAICSPGAAELFLRKRVCGLLWGGGPFLDQADTGGSQSARAACLRDGDGLLRIP